MSKNYLTYPCKVMNITQGYTESYTHSQHNAGSPKDYPWDEACSGSGRDWMYCPCDEIKVMRIVGVGNGYTNTIWLQSTSKALFADGTSDYFTMLITHPNDDDLKKIKSGQLFTRGQQICREGTDGQATGNHFHFSAGKGKYKGNGWVENSKGKWVLTCSVSAFEPEELFYIDPLFTEIRNSKGLNFKKLPDYKLGKYVVDTELLRIRKGPGTEYAYKKFNKLSKKAQKVIKKLTGGKEADGYVKGQEFTVYRIKNERWGYNASGWMCLDYCKRKG